jgi:hypothetical protein
MDKGKKKTVQIELTAAQKKLIKEETGKDATAIKLTAEELEERISPRKRFIH